ncbi:glycine betaine/proline transport system permease protein [Draconibacterium orientale]|uniref:Glycine betaine/proline transport system permease protein n=1 Tax=Draconibacterium orientale TaxID=1168034 RepID=X5DKF2_9BACT|nr:proline/glycine betaine ABC transporter permease [Draconibacterium orientale]AHW61027.1 glycine/betaine ABC transporter [Draconibacterium orientale]SET56065.1 glycine betaine/proline transport system permease protein [Draconibacterium orientale]
MDKLIDLGKYIEQGINVLEESLSGLWGAIDDVISWTVEFLNDTFLAIPFIVIIALVTFGAYYANAGKKAFKKEGIKKGVSLALFVVLGLLLIWAMGYWKEAIQTTTLVIVATIIALLFGIPLGIWAARSNTANAIIRPILDLMQTMPAFVYLIPAIFFFSVGNTPGVIATVIFSLPPAVRLTSLGIRNVPEDVIEAGHAFGATDKQILFKIQLPLAKTTILAGINQVILLALSMVVIASMVGAKGLGAIVYQGIQQNDIAKGFESGLGIVVLAIILDRITQAVAKK